MRYLRLYNEDADFKAYEQNAGGDGDTVQTIFPGVAKTLDNNSGVYYNPVDAVTVERVLTINYKDSYNTPITSAKTETYKYIEGVTSEIVVTPINIEEYESTEPMKVVNITTTSAVDFTYKSDLDEFLTFEILSGGTIGWSNSNSACPKVLAYSVNDGEWKILSAQSSAYAYIQVNAGDVVKFSGDTSPIYTGYSAYYNKFIREMRNNDASYNVKGNIMSLVGFQKEPSNSYAFYLLFGDCNVVDASKLKLPAKTLTNCCYQNMFSNCTALTAVPELPATTLANSCYNGMFLGCTSLTTAPELPTTTLAESCYESMFAYCTNLTRAPELPALVLGKRCYESMFANCTNLTRAPELPALVLGERCYGYMFHSCTSLTTAPELPATTLAKYCYCLMFGGCTSLTAAPELPALTLAQYCYEEMFAHCSNLRYIKAMFTTKPGNSYTSFWVDGVASDGIFVKNRNATWDEFGTRAVPVGWTVQTESPSE